MMMAIKYGETRGYTILGVGFLVSRTEQYYIIEMYRLSIREKIDSPSMPVLGDLIELAKWFNHLHPLEKP